MSKVAANARSPMHKHGISYAMVQAHVVGTRQHYGPHKEAIDQCKAAGAPGLGHGTFNITHNRKQCTTR
jgi:hypothetical protein